jgi:hypothetical protein
LNAVAIVALKRDLPSLRIKDKGAEAMLYVRVTSIQIPCGYAVSVEVSLERRVAILREDDSEVTRTGAAIWDKETVMAGSAHGMSSRIDEFIRDVVTEFAADYYK